MYLAPFDSLSLQLGYRLLHFSWSLAGSISNVPGCANILCDLLSPLHISPLFFLHIPIFPHACWFKLLLFVLLLFPLILTFLLVFLVGTPSATLLALL